MIKLSIAPATETECGVGRDFVNGPRWCPLFEMEYGRCAAFEGEFEYDEKAQECKRLPACIAAEVGEA